MSRYVRIELAPAQVARDQVLAALAALGLPAAVAELPGGLMLAGNFECADEPVDLHLPAGTLGTVADFGLRLDRGGWRLVCGEHDRAHLQDRLLGPLQRELAAARVREAAARAGLDVELTGREGAGLRLRVRPRE